jgi:ankyrin repeat protein
LLLKGIDINAPVTTEPIAAVPLHVAILHRQSHVIPTLFQYGADLNIPDSEKEFTPLIMATILEDEWTVRQLLLKNVIVNARTREGRTAMYVAIEKGQRGIIRLLIELGKFNVNAPTTSESHRGSALHVAVTFNQISIIHLLLSLGADPTLPDRFGRTPLQLAETINDLEAVRLLQQSTNNHSTVIT